MHQVEDPTLPEFVIARFDQLRSDWQTLARVRADDRIDALDRWALEQGGFDVLAPGLYGARHEDEHGPWYRRTKAT